MTAVILGVPTSFPSSDKGLLFSSGNLLFPRGRNQETPSLG